MDRRFFRLVGLLLLLISSTALADPLQLTVRQKGSGEPIAGATVVLSSSGQYQISDPAGRVNFESAALPLMIKVLALGHETFVGQLDTNTIYLYPLRAFDEGLEVVAERIPDQVSKLIINKEELWKTPGANGNPLAAIQTLPGVVVAGEQSPQLYVRGSGAEENLVWVNGITLPYLYHGGGYSVINPDLIDDFNILLGGFPVEYSDRLGGVIDVQLRAPRRDRWRQKYRLAINEAALLVEGPVGKDSVYFAARRSYLDLVMSEKTFGNLIGLENDEITSIPVYSDMQALWRRPLKRGYLDYQFYTATDSIELIRREDIETDPESTGKLRSNLGFRVAGLTWQQQWDARWDSAMTASVSNLYQDFQIGQALDGTPYFVKGNYWESTLRPEFRYQSGAGTQWQFGSEITYAYYPLDVFFSLRPSEDLIDFNLTELPKYRIERTIRAGMAAAYAKQRRQLTQKLTSVLGIRYATVRGSGGIDMADFVPRAALEYQLSKPLLLTAAWGRYIQMPRGSDILQGFSNPLLGFTKAEHRILGLRYTPDSLWSLQLETYYKPMQNLSLPFPDQPPPDNFQNAGSGRAYGIDLLIKREYRNRRMGWLSYSYARTERRNDITGISRRFSGDQPHTLTLVWGQPLPGSWRRWDWSLRLEARSGKPFTPVTGREQACVSGSAPPCGAGDLGYWRPLYAKQNSARLANYFRLDLRLERPILFNQWKMNVYFDFRNVSARKNIIAYDYGDAYQDYANPRPINSAPFIPFFGIEAEF